MKRLKTLLLNSKLLLSSDLSEKDFQKLPHTEYITANTFWFGVYSGITSEKRDYIIKIFKALLDPKKK